MHIGINASRARSGGARSHLIGLINNVDPTRHNFEKISVWSYSELLNLLPNKDWLNKREVKQSSSSIFTQLFWEKFILKKKLKISEVDILLNVDAGSVCRYKPSVTMSRDMLAFEPGEAERFGLSRERFRQFFLKFIQCHSLNNSTGSIFLTEYAGKMIRKICSCNNNYKIIPHGVSDDFRGKVKKSKNLKNNSDIIVTYISPVWLYKHQCNVVLAVKKLRDLGFFIKLRLIGGGDPSTIKKLEKYIKKFDPTSSYVNYLGEVEHKKLPKYLSETDVFVFASSCENMPNSLIEAMAFGLPIACSNRGPMPEILKDGGEYFDPEDSNSIVEAIKNIYNSDMYKLTLAERAKQLSKKYSWSRCADETMEFLIGVANSDFRSNKIKKFY